jgi:putative transcriptional regulator
MAGSLGPGSQTVREQAARISAARGASMKSLRGNLLIASPELLDPNFFRSVVLVVEHGTDGAFGLILNRRTNRDLKELWDKLSQQACPSRLPLDLGGPVPGPLMAVHTQMMHSDVEVLPGVYFSMQKQELDELVGSDVKPLRVFIGHAGWAGGQLEGEIGSGDWIITPATYEYVFHNEEDLWRKVTGDLVSQSIQPALRIKHVPSDPTHN